MRTYSASNASRVRGGTADDAVSFPDCAVAFAAAADVRSSSCPAGCTYTTTPDYSGSLTFTTPMETGFYTLALYDEIECTDPRPCDEVVEEKPDIISLTVRTRPPAAPPRPCSLAVLWLPRTL